MREMASSATSEDSYKSDRRAYVAFGGQTELPWLRLLKQGFRHCFLVLEAPGCWILHEPLSHRTEITVIQAGDGFEPAVWLRHFDYTVIPATVSKPPRTAAPWGPFTCVEAVKRVLGVRDGFILTPWRLHEFLREQNEKIVDSSNEIGL
ncbi:MAG: hypothetical protein JKY20_04030 [Alphaproteobacteria bacterium]|nr:hypothetical protein [Alphaproteobacteria bacterium]